MGTAGVGPGETGGWVDGVWTAPTGGLEGEGPSDSGTRPRLKIRMTTAAVAIAPPKSHCHFTRGMRR